MPTSGVDRVYLARRGRTALNAVERLHGLSDSPLDDVGQGITERTACNNQISRVGADWRVAFFDRKPQ